MRGGVLLLIVSLMTLQLGAQTRTVRIHGNIKDTVSTIELTIPADATLSKWVDLQVPVYNGLFDTSIELPFPSQIWIKKGMVGFRNSFISNDAEVLIDADAKLQIKGSQMHDEYEQQFLPFFSSNDQLYDSLESFMKSNAEKYGPDVSSLAKDSVQHLAGRYFSQRAELLSQYIKRHPNSYVALWDINHMVSITPAHRYFDFENLFSSFSNQMQQHSFINVLRKKVKASATLQEGQLFPKEFFKGFEKLEISLRKTKRYYLVDFWFSRCSPCIREFPKLKRLYEQYHPKGFDIVSISVDPIKDEKNYRTAVQKYELVWNHIWDRDAIKAKHYTISSFPTYVLLDHEGRIINYGIQIMELEAFLEKNL